MTDNIKNEIDKAKNEKVTIDYEVGKYKNEFAESLLKNKDAVIDSVKHPYTPTKKDRRRYKWMKIKNNFKKIFGL